MFVSISTKRCARQYKYSYLLLVRKRNKFMNQEKPLTKISTCSCENKIAITI